MQMRPSRVLKKLRQGGIVSCTKLNLCDARAAEIAAMFDFDCIWLGMEHGPNDLSEIEKQIYAAKGYDVDVVVRVARGCYSDYVRPLELDASGIMVPHVMSLEDAQNVVRMTRFHPVGRRPVDGGNADGKYCNVPFLDYLKQANEERFVILQIEDPEPLDELDAICALEGVDIILFGPGDFSHSIGAPGQFDHPDLLAARQRVAECANKHGKVAGTVGGLANLQELIDMGYRFVNLGADVIALSQYYKQTVEGFREHETKYAESQRKGE
jgi:4-hydroxy-2-oxoheptanedioate aldolase